MADTVTQRNIGSLLSTVTSVRPQAAFSAGAQNGVSIDRVAHSMAGCCVLHTGTGAASGAPTATSVTTKLQHSPDNSTWADYAPDGVNVATAAAVGASSDGSLSVDLTLANRYIRAVATVAFTGGTSPTVFATVDVILSGENTLAAV